MKYVSLLRGINVGGKNLVQMARLRIVFEELGYSNVVTYINSGNVIFDSTENRADIIIKNIERSLSQAFGFELRIVLRSENEIKKILDEVPDEWKKENDLRTYIAFIKEPMTSEEVLKEIEIKDGVDSVKKGIGVVYLSTQLNGITKSSFTKLVGKKSYKYLTIRNYTTSKKIFEIMGRNLS